MKETTGNRYTECETELVIFMNRQAPVDDHLSGVEIYEDDTSAIRSEPEAKWGGAIKAGYQILPDSLLRAQHILKLTATDIVVIANLNQAWWYSDRLPHLQPHTIAKRMGISERSVQRSLRRLRQKRLLRQVRERQGDGTVRYYHDLGGLRGRLEEFARRDIRYSETLRAGPQTM